MDFRFLVFDASFGVLLIYPVCRSVIGKEVSGQYGQQISKSGIVIVIYQQEHIRILLALIYRIKLSCRSVNGSRSAPRQITCEITED
jgi:hypothetical protein